MDQSPKTPETPEPVFRTPPSVENKQEVLRDGSGSREEARKPQNDDESSPPTRSPPAERVSSNESRPSPKNENLDGPAAERTSNAASEENVIQSDDAHGPPEFDIPKKQDTHPTEALVEEGTASTTVPSKQHDTKSDECKEDAVIQQNEKIDVGETSSSLEVKSKDQSGESVDKSSSSSSKPKSSIPDSEPEIMSSEGATGLDRSRAMELSDLTPTELDLAMFIDTTLDLFYSSPNYTAEDESRAIDTVMSTLRRALMPCVDSSNALIAQAQKMMAAAKKKLIKSHLAYINARLRNPNILKVYEEHLVEFEKENLQTMKLITNAETSFASLNEALKSILNSLNVNKGNLDATINEFLIKFKEASDDLECKFQEFDSNSARIVEHGAKIRKIELKVETLSSERRIKENTIRAKL